MGECQESVQSLRCFALPVTTMVSISQASLRIRVLESIRRFFSLAWMSVLPRRIAGHSILYSTRRLLFRLFSGQATRGATSTTPIQQLKSTNMHWTASVLSTVSADSEPSVMINFDNARYMINAGENAVRALCHSQTNRKRVQAIFMTRLTLERAGGLNGEYSVRRLACY